MAFRFGGLLAAAVALSTAAALAAGSTGSQFSLELRGAGSTFGQPLIAAWIKAREEADPSVALHYDPTGSSAGIHSFLAGDVDFAATDRPLSEDEWKAASGVTVLPYTAGMVVIAYNLPHVTTPLRLSRETLAGIFSGAVQDWDDPKIRADNPGVELPDRTIALAVRREGSGTTYAFTSYLAAISPEWDNTGPGVGDRVDWPHHAMTAFGNEGVAGDLANTEYSIGYVEYGFAARLALKTAVLQNRDGAFVAANTESGAAALAYEGEGAMPKIGDAAIDPSGANAYPIVTFSWLLLHKQYRSPDMTAALHGFVDLGLSADGQTQSDRLGYVPLPPAAVKHAQSVLTSLR
jgi:phosphate transport system substrate-binding protein